MVKPEIWMGLTHTETSNVNTELVPKKMGVKIFTNFL